jgi:diadenosine tetraphosphate (Ap4A) HIT family hydrolase
MQDDAPPTGTAAVPDAFDFPGQQVVLENEHALFLQKPEPVLTGSGVIVPKAARRTVFDLTPEEWQATHVLLRQAKRYLDDKYAPDGYTLGWNCEEAGGQSIFHAHLHVVPRFNDEPLAGNGLRFHLKQPENQRAQPENH